MYSKIDNCVEHPLGILCKCTDYQEIVNEFKSYSIGTEHYLLPKMNTGEQSYISFRYLIR